MLASQSFKMSNAEHSCDFKDALEKLLYHCTLADGYAYIGKGHFAILATMDVLVGRSTSLRKQANDIDARDEALQLAASLFKENSQ